MVEIYDTITKERMKGDDTECRVTILDDDCPGILSFEKRHIYVNDKQKDVSIKILRTDGSSGVARCKCETEEMTQIANNAEQFKHYVPFDNELIFANTETEKVVKIDILGKTQDLIDKDLIDKLKDLSAKEDGQDQTP